MCRAVLHSSLLQKHSGSSSGWKTSGRKVLWQDWLLNTLDGLHLTQHKLLEITAGEQVLPISIVTRAREGKWKKYPGSSWPWASWKVKWIPLSGALQVLVSFAESRNSLPPFVSQFVLLTWICLLGAPSLAQTNIIWVLLWKWVSVQED